MATILKFESPNKPHQKNLVKGAVISSTVNDVMLIIHHALHGEKEDYRPKDKKLAAQLLEELACHIKRDSQYDHIVLSHQSSTVIATRYPEMMKRVKY